MTDQTPQPAPSPGPAPAPAPPVDPAPWLADLPDDLKADATLSRYADVPALAKAHIEAHKVAKSKLAIPGEGATDEDWGKVWNALGRPETPDGYDIKTIELPVDAPEEARAALAEAVKPFKEFAHQLGLTSAQATALSEFDLQRTADFYAKGQAEVDAIKTRLGADYEPKKAAAARAFQQVFPGEIGERLAQELDRKVGSGALVEGGMRLAEIMGEAKLIDTDHVEGFGAVENAQVRLTELQNDKTWRDKLKAGDPTVVAQHTTLLQLAARQALRRGAN